MSYDSFSERTSSSRENFRSDCILAYSYVSYTCNVPLKVFSYMIAFFQPSLNILLTWSCVSDGLKKIHNTGEICSENRKADNDGGCLL